MPMLRKAGTALRSMSVSKNGAGGGSSGGPLGGLFQETQGGLVYLGATQPGNLPPVTDTSAMGLSAFYRGIRLIAASIAKQPLNVFDETIDADGNEHHKKVRLERDAYLWRKPNNENTRIVFWETVIAHEAGAGNAFLYVELDGLGLPGALWPISPRRVKVGRARNGGKVYLVDDRIPLADFADGGEIIHVPGLGYDGLIGYSPVRIADQSLALGLSAQQYATGALTESSVPPGVLSTEQTLTERQANAIRRRWEEQHEGLRNAHKLAVLSNGTKYQSIGLTPADAQLLETRKFQVLEVARLLGIPPHLLAEVEKSTSWGTGIEEQSRGFAQYTLDDHQVRFEQAISDSLLGGTTRYAKWDMRSLLRAATLQRYQSYALAINARWMSPNEARAFEDMEPYDGGDEILVLNTYEDVDAILNPEPDDGDTDGDDDAAQDEDDEQSGSSD